MKALQVIFARSDVSPHAVEMAARSAFGPGVTVSKKGRSAFVFSKKELDTERLREAIEDRYVGVILEINSRNEMNRRAKAALRRLEG